MKTFQTNYKAIFSGIILALLISSCEYDNFDAPETTINGNIVDSSGNLVPTQEPNGTRIRLYEQGYDNVQPIAFWGKQDGTFEYSRIFSADYKVIADGPFFPMDTVITTIQNTKSIDIQVVPFLSLNNVQAVKSGSDIVVDFSISRTQVIGKINNIAVFVNTTPFVDSNNFISGSKELNVSGVDDSEILTNSYQETISGLETGRKYYIRAAARASNSGNYYNYSNLLEVNL